MTRGALLLGILLFASVATARGEAPSTTAERPEETGAEAIEFLEARVASDPEDIVAWNRLGDLYLAKLRATGDHDYLDQAARCAEASLRAVPYEQNRAGFVLQIRSKFGAHRFAEAESMSRRLIEIDPAGHLGWQLLGDALLELGRYAEAPAAFEKAVELGGVTSESETRLARVAILRGDRATARRRLQSAKALAAAARASEITAWCEWQLGELAFGSGDWRTAGKHYDAALAINPRSIPVLGARARLQAARGDLRRAMAAYDEAIALDAFPPFVAALSDLHAASGNAKRAEELLALIEENASSPREQRLDRRHLARIYADRDIRTDKAYELAKADYAERQDIHAADTLAWAALKAGRLDEAQRAMAEALRLGTEDAALFYHAGMVALASGDKPAARKWLERALKLNPGFDYVQTRRAREALEKAK
ncbi:MAG: tetratricopeptide repeat protein [Thermoanaerobaculia bacterium]|nr:tetratricopeptide repeat protein [Thermoanaerobaculia bacterium]